MLGNSCDPAAPVPGLLYLGLGAGDVTAAATHIQAGRGTQMAAAGDHGTDGALLTDADGTPLEVSLASPGPAAGG